MFSCLPSTSHDHYPPRYDYNGGILLPVPFFTPYLPRRLEAQAGAFLCIVNFELLLVLLLRQLGLTNQKKVTIQTQMSGM
jgi:hypothetical protein